MPARFLVLLFLFTCGSRAAAQRETYIWYFGNQAGLDFNPGQATAISSGMLHTDEGCAAICDSSGNLLFYSDGNTVYNRNHLAMPNGSNLSTPWFSFTGTWSSTQAALIVKQPASTGTYFLFTTESAEADTPSFMYSIIDMSLQAGLGDVTAQKAVVLQEPVNERCVAAPHSNGTDAWIICNSGSVFYAYPLSASGLGSTPVVSNTGPVLAARGYMRVSPDGKKIAVAAESRIVLYDFNPALGTLNNPLEIGGGSYMYSLEFSPDGTKLYTNHRMPEEVHQYDISISDINGSQTKVGSSGYGYGAFQTGPDQRIYIASENNPYLDVIANPNAPGLQCDYRSNAVYLDFRSSLLGLPNHYSGYQRPRFTWQYRCSWQPVLFHITDSSGIQSVSWNFGDPASGAANTSALFSPGHLYASPGDYMVTLVTTGLAGNDTTVSWISYSEIDSLCENDIYIPNAFSPNGDGQNDILFVRSNTIRELDFRIYNRWGEEVFVSSDLHTGWDGKHRGDACETGVFVYALRAKMKNGSEVRRNGNITLLR